MVNGWKQKLRLRLPVIGLLAATLIFWGFYELYESDGPVLLQTPSMADVTRAHGDCSEENGHFFLNVPAGGKPARINFRLPNATHFDRIRVQGRMKIDGVIEGKNPWRCARLLLVQYDERNKWIPGHHGVVAETGTRDWMAYEDVFEVDPRASHIDLVIQQTGKAGSAEFDRILAEPIRLRSSFRWWRWAFAGVWILMAALYFRRCRLHRRSLRVLILLNAIAIIFGSLMPGKWIEDASVYVKEEAVKVVEKSHDHKAPSTPSQTSSPDRVLESEKIDQFSEIVGGVHGAGHFILFASLCFLIYLSAALERQPRSYFLKVAFDVMLFASVTESLQYLTLDRTPGIRDWLVDLFGMATALVCFLILLIAYRSCRLKQVHVPSAGKESAT